MPRRARREFSGGLGHVTTRTVRRLPLFLTESDALAYLDLLDFVTRDVADWSILAYCLMPNHVHLVVNADIDELGHAMHRVNGLYAQRFNREHGFTGHLFQGRYHLKPIVDEAHLPGSLRYVVLNPVRAGLCARPENWRWSSYRATIGLAAVPRFLDLEQALGSIHSDAAKARARFRGFVEEQLAFDAEAGTVEAGTVPGTVPSIESFAAAGRR
jgi:putative transposase